VDGEGITGLNRLTKKQRKAIAHLGAEWGVLESAERLISRLVFEQYQALLPGMKRPPELVELDREQDEIFKRKREIIAETDKLENGIRPRRRAPGKKSNAFVQVRSTIIRAARHLSDEDICKRLDFELSPPTPPMGLPESWTEKYGVKSYSEAYRHKKCRGLVQKLISVAKAPH
jgi:hypothetical protein